MGWACHVFSGVSNLWRSGFGDRGGLFLAMGWLFLLLPGSCPAHHLAGSGEQVANLLTLAGAAAPSLTPHGSHSCTNL